MINELIDIMEDMWIGHTLYVVVFIALCVFAWKKPGTTLTLLLFVLIPLLILGLMGEEVFWVTI
ncbi:MAG: hypothetical protein ACYTCV_03855, partial [Planctomycetota bacterium]